MSLSNRNALVTGAGRGIGHSTAIALAGAGANVAVSSRTLADLQHTAAKIEDLGRQALPIVCDVTNSEQVNQMVEEAEQSLGSIDILVNSAGAAGSHKFLGHPDELWNRMLDINLTSMYRVCKAVVPHMVERKQGRIINIASVAAKTGLNYAAAYVASKHGVLGLTRALAVELNRYNITVNALCPGYVDTPMTEATILDSAERSGRTPEEVRQIIEAGNPQGRLIDPEEVASVVVFLADDSARSITSQAINIEGGAILY